MSEVFATRHERPRPARLRASPHAWWIAVAAVCLGAFMGQLDASIVTLTYDSIGVQFGAPLAAVGWVSLSYLVVVGSVLITVGRLSDRLGRKRVYLWGFGLFGAASLACAIAPSLPLLVAARAVQGLGAAMLQANSVALVALSAPRQLRRAALGIQAAAQAVGLALGPTVGGLLVAGPGWRWVFAINVPVALFALVSGRFVLPRTRVQVAGRTPEVDWAMAACLAGTVVAVLLMLSGLGGLSLPGFVWIVATVLICLGGGWLARRAHLVPAGRRVPMAGLTGALCAYLALFGPLVLVPVVASWSGGHEALVGLSLLPLPLGFAVAATLGERLAPRTWTNQIRCTAGSLIAVAGMSTLVFAQFLRPLEVPALAVIGIGCGLFNPANNAAIMATSPAALAASAGGMINTARALGTAAAVAIVTLVLHIAIGFTGTGPAAAAAAAGALVVVCVAQLATSLRDRPRPAT